MRRTTKLKTDFDWDNFDKAPESAPQPVATATSTPAPPSAAPAAPPVRKLTEREIAVEYQLWSKTQQSFLTDGERQTAFQKYLLRKQQALAARSERIPDSRRQDSPSHLSSDSIRKPVPVHWINSGEFRQHKALSSDQFVDVDKPAETSLLESASTKFHQFLDFLGTDDDNSRPAN